MATSVKVSTNGREVICSPKYTELLRDTLQTISVIDDKTMQQQTNPGLDAFRTTGEAGGAVGQSIASAPAIAGVFLVYTGTLLATWRLLTCRARSSQSQS